MVKGLKDYDIIFDEIEVEGLTKDVLPEPELLEYYNRLSRREILWNADIGTDAVDLASLILRWNRKDKDIPVFAVDNLMNNAEYEKIIEYLKTLS